MDIEKNIDLKSRVKMESLLKFDVDEMKFDLATEKITTYYRKNQECTEIRSDIGLRAAVQYLREGMGRNAWHEIGR